MRVKDLMSRDVVTCRAESSANEAARLMWEHDCGVVSVVDLEQRPVGMITDRDVCMASYTTGRRLAEIRVGDVMSRDVQTCDPEDSVSSVELAMKRRKVRRLPAVDSQGKVVGLISLNDIARGAAKQRGKAEDGLGFDNVAETLASLCEPWRSIEARPAACTALVASPRAVDVPVLAR